jgi:hypothetical protein
MQSIDLLVSSSLGYSLAGYLKEVRRTLLVVVRAQMVLKWGQRRKVIHFGP